MAALTLDDLRNKIETAGLGEWLAVATAAAASFSTLYNLGYFASTDWHMVSLLSFQDIIISSLVSLPAILLIFMLYILLVARNRTLLSKIMLYIYIFALISGIVLAYTGDGTNVYTVTALVIIAIFIMSSIYAAKHSNTNGEKSIFLGVSVVIIVTSPVILGVASYNDDVRRYKEGSTDIILNDGSELKIYVLKISSGYVFYYDGQSVGFVTGRNIRSLSTERNSESG